MRHIASACLIFFLQMLCAWGEPLNLEPGKTIDSGAATQMIFVVQINGQDIAQPLAAAVFTAGKLQLTQPLIDDIRKRVPTDPESKVVLQLKDAGNVLVKQFELDRGLPAAARSQSGSVPDWVECATTARDWQSANPAFWNDGRDTVLLLFNRNAQTCYISTAVPKSGDRIIVGVVAAAGEQFDARPSFSQCTAESTQPGLNTAGNPRVFFGQRGGASTYEVRILEVLSCFDKNVRVAMVVTPAAPAAEIKGERMINFYERFRGTLQLGVMFTGLRQNEFALRDVDGQQQIFNKSSTRTGPEYVASLAIYGLPRYFTADALKGGYRGRDVLNHNGLLDRIGMTLSAGLEDPGEQFGVGLSFEIAYGINLTVNQLWFRQRSLVGLREGDMFAGAASDIITRKDWEDDTVVGLSIDLRYVSSLFQGK